MTSLAMRGPALVPCLAVLWLTGSATAQNPGNQEIVLKASSTERGWLLGERIGVECVNRTIDTGEHITNSKGELQYNPFPTCNETGRPLELVFGSEVDINCTIAEVSDPLFHLFEFYIHNDAPLSCRLASVPASSHASVSSPSYTTLQIALSGTLQLSHLHINPQLNVIVHTTSSGDSEADSGPASSKRKSKAGKKQSSSSANTLDISEGRLLAATAYSLPYTSTLGSLVDAPRIIIGDTLPLVLSMRWFSERTLPPSTARLKGAKYTPPGLGGHVHVSTVFYCLLSFGGGVAVSLAYWRGVELPRRLRRYGAEKLGLGFEGGRSGYAFPGKRD